MFKASANFLHIKDQTFLSDPKTCQFCYSELEIFKRIFLALGGLMSEKKTNVIILLIVFN